MSMHKMLAASFPGVCHRETPLSHFTDNKTGLPVQGHPARKGMTLVHKQVNKTRNLCPREAGSQCGVGVGGHI